MFDDSITLELIAEHPDFDVIANLKRSFRNCGHLYLQILTELELPEHRINAVHMSHTRPDEPPEEGSGDEGYEPPDLETVSEEEIRERLAQARARGSQAAPKPKDDLDAYTEEIFEAKKREDTRLKSEKP